MKIEKLTDNKIRVLINISEFDFNNIDSFIKTAFNDKKLFLDILSKAEQEINFNTDGCKLIIESLPNIDEFVIFIITKYVEPEYLDSSIKYSDVKKLTTKRKTFNSHSENSICIFDNFDNFCDFNKFILSILNNNSKIISNNISLYIYNNKYYFIIKKFSTYGENYNNLLSLASEFGKIKTLSNYFESKLIEKGTKISFNKLI